ncbi:DUF192 domain-containing protein [Rubrobacter indicoceani]|uniref:DUF192 domain-containing protein n=1 Tax=Rubrobacter indicoceani TaxID=2051957 RepID=UPI000E5BECA2|nr:DUF192 domain-containing protein [Rubrobacter indicoceani]
MGWRSAISLAFAAGVLLTGCGGNPDPEQSAGEPQPATAEATAEVTTNAAGGECARPDFAADTPNDISTEALPMRDLTIVTRSGDDVTMQVEVADSSQEMSQGLMFRESLGENCGMLFAYPDERDLSFWMRNTLIPLSIAYADSEGEIVDLQDMEALDDEPPNYASSEPAQYALEVNVGFFERNGVRVGDVIELPE